MAENNNNNNNNNNNSHKPQSSRNHRGNHHRNSNNSDNITKFVLGACENEGNKYEFRYDNGTYTILLLKEEGEDLLLKTKEKEKAYPEWNLIKRPEKKSKQNKTESN